MDSSDGYASGSKCDSILMQRYLELCSFADALALEYVRLHNANPLPGGQPAPDQLEFFSNNLMEAERRLVGTHHPLMVILDFELADHEREFIYSRCVVGLRANHGGAWGVVSGAAPTDAGLIEPAMDARWMKLKTTDGFKHHYGNRPPIIPVYEYARTLPPQLTGDRNFVAFIGSDVQANASFFFDTMQSAHMTDVSSLINAGQVKGEMRQVSKKDASKYTVSSLAEFWANGVMADLVDAFLSKQPMIPQDGTKFDLAVQGKLWTNGTKAEMSAYYLCDHYYVYLHCYPG